MDEGSGPRIEVRPDGPLRVSGAPLARVRRVLNEDGRPVEWERLGEIEAPDPYELCRCGRSRSMPFCDGSESEGAESGQGFDGTETADRGPTAGRRRSYGEGPLVLTDDPSLCASAGFCTLADTTAWELAQDTTDPDRRARVVAMVERCPSGRLQYHLLPDRFPVEKEIPREVAVIEDGPAWVRGEIPVEGADGFEYEVRNRMTLCRCGSSRNKPFCDGSHLRVGFTDRRS